MQAAPVAAEAAAMMLRVILDMFGGGGACCGAHYLYTLHVSLGESNILVRGDICGARQ